MGRSRSADASIGRRDAERLLDIAQAAILDGLGEPTSAPQPGPVSTVTIGAGMFVTLTVDGGLNGCIGSVGRSEPFVAAVDRLARSAAFADPRLPALTAADLPTLVIEISLLSELTELTVTSRQELVEALRPGTDGLMLSAGRREGLFLPAVWEQLAHPEEFVDRLYAKAGIRPRSWSHDLRASTFTTVTFRRTATGAKQAP